MHRIKDLQKTLPIIEIYAALQGEGSRRGSPNIIIRTTGCTHRCYFGDSKNWCDTWYSSIHPIKGKFCFDDIIKICDKYTQIEEIMITGGSPTMHPTIINEIAHLAKKRNMFVTLETEGSHFIKTDYKIDLISISPKFSNSVPQIGTYTPQNKLVTDGFVKIHNKYRLNFDAIKKMISYHKDYHIKPLCDNSETNIEEIKEFVKILNIPKNKVYLMPIGSAREQLIKNYKNVIEIAMSQGFNFTGRDHIIAYDEKRHV